MLSPSSAANTVLVRASRSSILFIAVFVGLLSGLFAALLARRLARLCFLFGLGLCGCGLLLGGGCGLPGCCSGFGLLYQRVVFRAADDAPVVDAGVGLAHD